MSTEQLTKEQVHAARDLLTGNVNDLWLLNFPAVLKLHGFLKAWSGGSREQLVETCKNIVKACSREELIAVQKYFFLPETRKDSNGDCLLDWCEEVVREAGEVLPQDWMAERLGEIHKKRANFKGCGKEYQLNPEGKLITLKVLKEVLLDRPELALPVKAVIEILEDTRYQKTSGIMEWLTLRLKCLEPAKVGELQEILTKQKQRGYVDWLLGAFQFALLLDEQEEVPFPSKDSGKLKTIHAF